MTNKRYQPLVDLLRSEIEAYGKLFQLLEQQRSALIQQDTELILSLSKVVDEHAAVVKQLNSDRKILVSTIHPQDKSSILSLLTHIKDPDLQLFNELVREINRLIRESQRQLSRNQMLYRRALEVSQETLRILRPDDASDPGIYKRDGYLGERRRKSFSSCAARSA